MKLVHRMANQTARNSYRRVLPRSQRRSVSIRNWHHLFPGTRRPEITVSFGPPYSRGDDASLLNKVFLCYLSASTACVMLLGLLNAVMGAMIAAAVLLRLWCSHRGCLCVIITYKLLVCEHSVLLFCYLSLSHHWWMISQPWYIDCQWYG
jgi:hypothetical protein